MQLQTQKIFSVLAKLSVLRLLRPGLAVALLVGFAPESSAAISRNDKNIELQIGIVQRFGRKPKDALTLQAPSGGRLSLSFQTDGKPQTITGSSAKFDLLIQPLTEARIEERVVLSTHRSFESAEDSASHWRAQGIPVEVAQPERWQVWAKREVYSTPLLRRLLIQSLQSQGIQTAFIDTQVLQQQPRASFVINGYRYTRDRVEISSKQGLIQVSQAGQDQSRRLYAGSLRLQPNAYGTYSLVNQVPLETYLRGVVPHEIGTFAAQSVLEVQAILARTYVLRNLRRFSVDGYQLCADTQCQVYQGLTGASPTTDRAIAATKGLVLTYQNELVDAVYSSSTGGVTAPFNDVWYGPERPYLRAVVDSVALSWDLSRKSLADEKNFRSFIGQKKGFNEEREEWFRWKFQSRLEDLNQELKDYLVGQKSPLAGFKTIQKMQVIKRSLAGRVLELAIITDQGTVTLQKDDVRKVFAEPASTLFYLEPVYDQKRVLKGYAFVGGGLGHGVGLSQTGSYHLGKLGWSSDRILRFYYPGTQLQRINDSIVFWRDQNGRTTN